MTKKRRVVDARADAEGDITHVRFADNSRFTPLDQAINMADQGLISNAHAVHPSRRRPYLRSNPDGRKANNLDELAGDHKPT